MAPGKTIRHSVNIVLLSDLNGSLNLNTILWWHFQQWLCVLIIYFTQLSTFNNPCRNKSFNFGCMTKLFAPPVTEMTSLGNSNFHSSCKRRRTFSASVSSEIRMNYRRKKTKPWLELANLRFHQSEASLLKLYRVTFAVSLKHIGSSSKTVTREPG